MMKMVQALIGAGTIAAIYYGGSYLLKLKRFANELGTETKVSIHKVSLTGVELSINVKLKNPSGGTLKVKHPLVKLIHTNKVIALSQVKDVNITIPKFGEASLDPIRIKLGFINLATTVPSLIKEYRASGILKLTVTTVTTINDSIPYSKTDEITLGGGKAA